MKYLIRALLSTAFLLALTALGGTAQAATGPFGRDWNQGYFTGMSPEYNWGWVFVSYPADSDWGLGPNCWQQCTMTEAMFIQAFQARLNDSDTIDAGRAAAIVDIMLGKQGPDFGGSITNGISYAKAHFQEWQNLVDLYAQGSILGYTVNWNDYIDFTGVKVSGMGIVDPSQSVPYNPSDCIPTEVKCIGDVGFVNNNDDPEFDYAVVFNSPGGNRFIIKHKCANLTGDVTPLARPTSAIDITKTSSNPAPMAIGTTMQYSFHVREVAPIPLNTVTIKDTLPAQFKYLGPAGGSPAPTSVSGQTLTWTFTAPADNTDLNLISTGGGLDLGVNVQALSTGASIVNTATGTAVDELNDSIPVNPGSTLNTVTSAPRYPSVEGHASDIHAGGGVCGGAQNSTGFIETNPNAASLNQYVVSAAGAQNNIGTNNAPGDTSLSIGPNGGYATVCRPDLYAYATTHMPTGAGWVNETGATLDLSNPLPGQVTLPNGQVVAYLSGWFGLFGNLNVNHPVTLVVNGNVWIPNDITVTGGSSRLDAPSLGIIASGTIDMHPMVSTVDAFLFSDSTIDTCVPNPPPLAPPQCDNILTINGFMMSNTIKLHRLGAMDQTGAQPAEIVTMNPALYLNPPWFFDSAVDSVQLNGQGERQPLF